MRNSQFGGVLIWLADFLAETIELTYHVDCMGLRSVPMTCDGEQPTGEDQGQQSTFACG